MSKFAKVFLSSKNNIPVNTELATEIGLNETIVLRQVYYWVEHNEAEKKNFKDGKYWVYNSIKQWKNDNFPFMSEKTIERAFSSLKKKNLILVGDYSKNRTVRPNWYTINDEEFDKLIEKISGIEDEKENKENGESNPPNRLNGLSQNDCMETDRMADCSFGQNDCMHSDKLTTSYNIYNNINNIKTENTTEITNQRIHTDTLSGERAVCECSQSNKEKETSNKTALKKEANALFEQLWSLYPLKKGKGNVSDSQKAKLLEIGYEELERAISRYIQYVESVDYLHYKNGSTFFNSGYIDYLDANYECSDNNNKPSVKAENYNNQKPEDENQSEQDFKIKLEAAKKKAIHELKLEDGYWEGVSDEKAEIYLEMLGIYL